MNTEYNPLVRTSWHMFGLLPGTLIAGAFTLAAIVGVSFWIGEREFLQGMLFGAYFVVHYFHYNNFNYISRKYLRRDSSFVDKIFARL